MNDVGVNDKTGHIHSTVYGKIINWNLLIQVYTERNLHSNCNQHIPTNCF